MERISTCLGEGPRFGICDGSVPEGAPVALCGTHIRKVYLFAVDMIEGAIARGVATQTDHSDWDAHPIKRSPRSDEPVVYYLRFGDLIKIGTTTSLLDRVADLGGRRRDVLGAEAGSYELEARRHQQFAHLRQRRREYFQASPELLEHIASLPPLWKSLHNATAAELDPNVIVTTREAAGLLGITTSRIGMWKVRGKVTPVQYNRQRPLFRLGDLIDLRNAGDAA